MSQVVAFQLTHKNPGWELFFSVVLTSLVVIVFNTNFFVSDSQYKTLTWKFHITLNIKNNGFVIHVNSLYISIN